MSAFWNNSFWRSGFWVNGFWSGLTGASAGPLQPAFVIAFEQEPSVTVELPDDTPPAT